MGCDIHGYIEVRLNPENRPNSWWKYAELRVMRNYAMFGLLAGVRSEDKPIVEPRGWDINSDTRSEYCLYIVKEDSQNIDNDGYCTMPEAERYVQYGSEFIDDKKWVTHPDWHTPSWLTADELTRAVDAYINLGYEKYGDVSFWRGLTAMLKEIPNSRFIFWFDN
jgi:hypothetical protein